MLTIFRTGLKKLDTISRNAVYSPAFMLPLKKNSPPKKSIARYVRSISSSAWVKNQAIAL